MNNAVPELIGQARSPGFYTEDTPPETSNAVAIVQWVLPRRFERQPSFQRDDGTASVRDTIVRVRVRGFVDDDSGVSRIAIVLYANSTVEIASGEAIIDDLLPV